MFRHSLKIKQPTFGFLISGHQVKLDYGWLRKSFISSPSGLIDYSECKFCSASGKRAWRIRKFFFISRWFCACWSRPQAVIGGTGAVVRPNRNSCRFTQSRKQYTATSRPQPPLPDPPPSSIIHLSLWSLVTQTFTAFLGINNRHFTSVIAVLRIVLLLASEQSLNDTLIDHAVLPNPRHIT